MLGGTVTAEERDVNIEHPTMDVIYGKTRAGHLGWPS
jgi:hypothetical protein